MYKRIHVCFFNDPAARICKSTHTFTYIHLHTYTHVNSQTECKEISQKSNYM